MEYDINLLKRQQDELLTRLNSLSVEQPKISHDDAYGEIEAAANKLSDIDKQELMKDQEYQQMVGELNMYIQQEQFRLIRNDLIKNLQAVEVMHKISQYITKFKNETDQKKASTLKTFEDYITNYSDMPYSEYLKCKNNKRLQ